MILKEILRLSILELKEAGIKTAELDARVLICASLDVSIEKFYLLQNSKFSPGQIKKIKLIIKKRAQNIPVAYILGHKEFYGLDFKVDKNVLIPRPETEGLVDKAIRTTDHRLQPTSILDMGTGCGNIIISLVLSLRGHSGDRSNLFFAADNSSAALKIARQNAKLHQVDNKIKFIQSDLFDKLKNQKFNLIIANLPYVPMPDCHSEPFSLSFLPIRHTQGKLQSESRSPLSDCIRFEDDIFFEPQSAIFSADNGAEIIKRFLKEAPNYLFDNGTILLELDPRNAVDLKNYAKKYFPKSKIKLSKDLAGFNRYLSIEY